MLLTYEPRPDNEIRVAIAIDVAGTSNGCPEEAAFDRADLAR